jgi:hypothetical protein
MSYEKLPCMILLTTVVLQACMRYLLTVLAQILFAFSPRRSPPRPSAHICFPDPYAIVQRVDGTTLPFAMGGLKSSEQGEPVEDSR